MSNHIETKNLPFVVCGTCEGNGTHGPGWVMTGQDVEEMGHEFYDYMEDMQEGRFDVVCDECKGMRVVKADCECEACYIEREQEWQDNEAARFEARWC